MKLFYEEGNYLKMKHFIEINELKKNENIIKEVLTRIGIKHGDKLYQSCHYMEVNNKKYILHFKEIFGLFDFIDSGKINKEKIKMNEEDIHRRNNIINLLQEWNMIKLKEETKNYILLNIPNVYFEIIKKCDINNYKLIQKVEI